MIIRLPLSWRVEKLDKGSDANECFRDFVHWTTHFHELPISNKTSAFTNHTRKIQFFHIFSTLTIFKIFRKFKGILIISEVDRSSWKLYWSWIYVLDYTPHIILPFVFHELLHRHVQTDASRHIYTYIWIGITSQ